MKKIRVLIVDDSASVRAVIASVLKATPDIDVVGEASDPFEAREAIKSLDPDVVTLDVEMPKMNGLDFLERVMRLRPTPIIMVSSTTSAGAETTIRALEIGAVDCVDKPNGQETEWFPTLAAKIRTAAATRGRLGRTSVVTAANPDASKDSSYKPDGRVVAIGSSTGGVEALISVLSAFPANCPPTVITQHMPATFTKSFAARLDRLCAPNVKEATDGAILAPGQIYLAPGSSTHHLTVTGSGTLRCRLREEAPVNGHCPSVDVLFNSVAKAAGSSAVGVILTGMGRDGAQGLLSMRNAGAETIGQDAESSLVYGMPKTAFEAGGVQRQIPLRRIGREIITLTSH
jgi:two-component system chemotaxis response regulator CheB